MAISVGISRIVVIAAYPEDGTKLLEEAGVSLVKLDKQVLAPWLSFIIQGPENSVKAAADNDA